MMQRRNTPDRRRAGFSLLEVLIVVAVVGALGAGLTFFGGTPSVRLFANDVESMLQQSRLEAIKRNRPVAIVWDSGSQTFRSRYVPAPGSNTIASACSSTTVLTSHSTENYKNLTVSTTMPGNGLVWLPNTLLSTCSGAMTGPVTVTVGDVKQSVTITISTAGQVSAQ
jgi:prepilin-type N-terminal cleavage/methylation domain-containing protein